MKSPLIVWSHRRLQGLERAMPIVLFATCCRSAGVRLDEQASIIKLSQLACALKGRISSIAQECRYGLRDDGSQFMAWIGSEFASSNLRINAVARV
ncbi:hypothetical protein XH88_06570 [Bradyrhizobium sp. CCBAU 51627]|nr:hypothetical protein [Bradyrhizobium sp. CCBAU 51627]